MAGLAGFLKQVEGLIRVAHPRVQLSGLGTSKLDEHGSWPRVVWIVPGAGHVAPEKSKPGGRTDGTQILTRAVNIEGHLWGKDLEQVEALVDDTIAAIHRVGHGSVRFDGETWLPDDVIDDGLVVVVRCSIGARVMARRFEQANATTDTNFTTTKPTGLGVDTTNAPT